MLTKEGEYICVYVHDSQGMNEYFQREHIHSPAVLCGIATIFSCFCVTVTSTSGSQYAPRRSYIRIGLKTTFVDNSFKWKILYVEKQFVADI